MNLWTVSNVVYKLAVLTGIVFLIYRSLKMAENITDLTAAEAAEETAIDAAVKEIHTLADELAAATATPNNQAEIDRLTAAIKAKTTALGAAVANPQTPA